eukprot:UN04572
MPSAMFWIVMDCTISSISIYLLFAWNDKKYKKYCSKLHAAFTNLNMLKIQRNHSDLKRKSKPKNETASKTTSTYKESPANTCTESPAICSRTLPSIEAIEPSLLANDPLQQSKIDLDQTITIGDSNETL